MNRCILIILSVFYLFSATALNIQFHYCMNELDDWGIGQSSQSNCGKCGMENKTAEESGCCKDEYASAKISVDQQLNSLNSIHFNFPSSPALITQLTIIPLLRQATLSSFCVDHAPSRSTHVPGYLFIRNIRI